MTAGLFAGGAAAAGAGLDAFTAVGAPSAGPLAATWGTEGKGAGADARAAGLAGLLLARSGSPIAGGATEVPAATGRAGGGFLGLACENGGTCIGAPGRVAFGAGDA